MTLPGDARRRSHSDQQFKAVEKTVMYRSTWELAAYVRHRTAYLADERRICSPIPQTNEGPANLLTQLRHRLGIGLIKIGHALAGYDTVRGLSTPPARPATRGSGS